MNAFRSLLARELRRFARRPSQIASTVATPVVIWVFLAAGFAGGDASYTASLAPGIAILVVLFATVFAGMSLIEDRHEGFLQGVLVSPAPRWATAGSKLAAATIIGTAQGVPLLLAAPLVGAGGGPLGVVVATVILVLSAVAVGGFGLALAWWIDSSRGFHGLFTVALMPLWILSGAIFPEDTASGWLVAVARVNPVGWCREATDAALRGGLADVPFALAGTVLFACAGFAAAILMIGRSSASR